MLPPKIIIPYEFAQQRLDTVLAQLFPQFSRSQLSDWLKNEKILLNNFPAKPKYRVWGEEEIQFLFDPDETKIGDQNPQAEAIDLNIVFEDEDVLVINKPAGLVVHPGAGNVDHTLVNGLVHYFPPLGNLARCGIIHRLDKDTTGLLIVAKNLQSQTQLIRDMQERRIKRRYLALVKGRVIAGGKICTFFGRDSKNRLKMAVTVTGKEAITFYKVLKHYQHFSLLDVELQTGRTHQIRVHMAYIKHPIIGDPLYGHSSFIPASFQGQTLGENLRHFKRQALHAAHLNFKHPRNQEELDLQALPPLDFQQLLDLLDCYDV